MAKYLSEYKFTWFSVIPDSQKELCYNKNTCIFRVERIGL